MEILEAYESEIAIKNIPKKSHRELFKVVFLYGCLKALVEKKSFDSKKEITEELVYEIVSSAKPKEIKEVLELAIKGNFVNAKEKLLETMLKHGLSGLDLIKQIQGEIWSLNLEDNKKIDLIDKCGEVEFRMVEGSDEFVQLEVILASCYSTSK